MFERWFIFSLSLGDVDHAGAPSPYKSDFSLRSPCLGDPAATS